ncbi:hypothetical protein L2E82_02395 [Cichorium intybus]|uniref:Uncharacterized protein n=1 Tax=Cichorium intybus TaxID=13427 RepID=A0ACB9H2M4_CICIN|nr:hypothetical protein L2E82_02395 [Cichorium intybus]
MTADLALVSNYPMAKASCMDLGKRVFGVPVLPRIIGSNGRKSKSFATTAVMQVGSIVKESKTDDSLGLDVVIETKLKEKGFLGLRKTKLVCTVGHQDVIRKIKKLNHEKGFCVSVMIDTEGSQIHVADHGGPSSVKAEDGSIWFFTTEQFEGCRPFTVQASQSL